jgi:hypothetical protein
MAECSRSFDVKQGDLSQGYTVEIADKGIQLIKTPH